jgi:hypothetical protein
MWGGYPPAPTWGPPPPARRVPTDDTVSGAGLPLGKRGAIGLDTSSFTGGNGDISSIAIALAASMPLARVTFLDARVPLGLTMDRQTDAVLGNITMGAHHVFRPGKRVWITLGGAVGLATLSADTHDHHSYEAPGAARAYWNLHEYFPDVLPIQARAGLDWHLGPVLLRAEVEPAVYVGINTNDESEFAVQEAIEIQIGHALGGGVRVQGAAFPTFDNLDLRHETERDLFQLAIEPFVVLERRVAFLRMGLLLPIDAELGPPLERSWGFRFSGGVRVE